MTEEELATLERDHAEQARLWDPYPTCSACSRCDCPPVPWPCDAALLVAEVRRLRAPNARA